MLARAKGGVDGNRIKSDAAFARTRENGKEFARAGSAWKLLRMAFRSQQHASVVFDFGHCVLPAGERRELSAEKREV
jgi:hypothetical protein